MATAAEVYTEAHGLHCFSFGKPYGKFQKNDKPMQKNWKGQQFDSAIGISKKEGKSDFTPRYSRCYNCNGFGHFANECKKPTKPKQEHPSIKQKYVPGAMKEINQQTRENNDSTEEKQVGSSPQGETSTDKPLQPCCTQRNNQVTVKCGHNLEVLNMAVEHYCNMPKVQGYISGKMVSVLRDTGCNSVVVWRELVSDEQLTGKDQSCVLIDGTVRTFPLAAMYINTPYYTVVQEIAHF